MEKEQIIHDLALIVVENILEDIDDDFGVRQYSAKAAEVYKQAVEIIGKQLEKEDQDTL